MKVTVNSQHSFYKKYQGNKEKYQLTRVRDTFSQRVSDRFIHRADTEGSGPSRGDSAESSDTTGGDRAGAK